MGMSLGEVLHFSGPLFACVKNKIKIKKLNGQQALFTSKNYRIAFQNTFNMPLRRMKSLLAHDILSMVLQMLKITESRSVVA